MREDDIFDDREAEAGAAGVARAVFVDAVESLENMGLVLERDSRAVVGKSELDAFADTLGCEVDFQGGDLAVLKRVEEQVRANLLDAAGVDLRMPRILRRLLRLERREPRAQRHHGLGHHHDLALQVHSVLERQHAPQLLFVARLV